MEANEMIHELVSIADKLIDSRETRRQQERSDALLSDGERRNREFQERFKRDSEDFHKRMRKMFD